MASIKENLLEMKTQSQLLVELAYSVVFSGDKTKSKEIKEIYEKIKNLEKETMKHLFKVKINDEQRIVIIELIDFMKDISKTAANIAELVSEPKASILTDMFKMKK